MDNGQWTEYDRREIEELLKAAKEEDKIKDKERIRKELEAIEKKYGVKFSSYEP